MEEEERCRFYIRKNKCLLVRILIVYEFIAHLRKYSIINWVSLVWSNYWKRELHPYRSYLFNCKFDSLHIRICMELTDYTKFLFQSNLLSFRYTFR